MSKEITLPKHLVEIAEAASQRRAVYANQTVADMRERLDGIAHQSAVTGIPLDLKESLACLGALCEVLSVDYDGIHSPHTLQVIGAAALYEGTILHMENGEGKTLAAALAAVLRAKIGMSVHISTQNNYLARRDATWMYPLYDVVGLTVATREQGVGGGFRAIGAGHHHVEPIGIRETYQANVLYAHRKQLGWDYLHLNRVKAIQEMYQQTLDFVIVDEVDSVLIDGARESLNTAETNEKLDHAQRAQAYRTAWDLSQGMEADVHFRVMEKSVYLTDAGRRLAAARLGTDIYRDGSVLWAKLINQCLYARLVMKEGRDYALLRDSVRAIDEETGRILPSNKHSSGFHQALLMKEGLPYEPETVVNASISIQNFYRQYGLLSGMSGSVWPVREEIEDVYGIRAVRLPTRNPLIRKDEDHMVLKTKRERDKMAVNDALERLKAGQPVLVGVEDENGAFGLKQLFNERNINPIILTATEQGDESEKIVQLRRAGTVMITARLAGRGTDIKLDEEAIAAGGLHVVVVGLMDKRIEDQLRGRAGRQGLPGSSSCMVSLDDEIMTLFNSHRVKRVMDSLNLEEDAVITHPWVTNSIARARRKVRRANYLQRKGLYEADQVIDGYRQYMYRMRRALLEGAISAQALLATFAENVVGRLFDQGRKEGQSLDDCTRRIIDALCRDIAGLRIDDFADVGESRRWNERSATVAASLTGFVERRIEAVRRHNDAAHPEIDLADVLLRMSVRDALDDAWGAFLEQRDAMYNGAYRQRIGSAWMGGWIRQQSHRHFMTTLADTERSAISTWARLSGMPWGEQRRVIVDQLRVEERWEDLLVLYDRSAVLAAEQGGGAEAVEALLAGARVCRQDLGSPERADDRYRQAVDAALATAERGGLWDAVIEACESAAEPLGSAALAWYSARMDGRDAALGELVRFVYGLEATDERQAYLTDPQLRLQDALLPATDRVREVLARRAAERLRHRLATSSVGEAMRWLQPWFAALCYWLGAEGVARMLAAVLRDRYRDAMPRRLRRVIGHLIDGRLEGQAPAQLAGTLSETLALEIDEPLDAPEVQDNGQLVEWLVGLAEQKYHEQTERIARPIHQNVVRYIHSLPPGEAAKQVYIDFDTRGARLRVFLETEQVRDTDGRHVIDRLEDEVLGYALYQRWHRYFARYDAGGDESGDDEGSGRSRSTDAQELTAYVDASQDAVDRDVLAHVFRAQRA